MYTRTTTYSPDVVFFFESKEKNASASKNGKDYSTGGMLMPGRGYTPANSYRYGFNGKENDNEVKGTGNQQDYGMRIYDPRLGKFLSVDPLFKGYPFYTPYQFSGNNPILNIDLDGLEELNNNDLNKGKTNGENQIKKHDADKIIKNQDNGNSKDIIINSDKVLNGFQKFNKVIEVIENPKTTPKERVDEIKKADLKPLPLLEFKLQKIEEIDDTYPPPPPQSPPPPLAINNTQIEQKCNGSCGNAA